MHTELRERSVSSLRQRARYIARATNPNANVFGTSNASMIRNAGTRRVP
jgi:hypothetical protein